MEREGTLDDAERKPQGSGSFRAGSERASDRPDDASGGNGYQDRGLPQAAVKEAREGGLEDLSDDELLAELRRRKLR